MGDTIDYQYQETVFVYGDLEAYLKSLEMYFRESIGNIDESISNINRNLETLTRDIEFHETKDWPFMWRPDMFRLPFEVDENNYHEAKEWFEKYIEYTLELSTSQKINRGRIIEILDGREDINLLNLTNYGYPDHITRIQFSDSDREIIRMRIFFDENAWDSYNKDRTHSFARGACCIKGVGAEVVDEEGISEKIPPLDLFIENNEIRRSRLRVKSPVFTVTQEGDQIKYSVQLSAAEIEMLSHFSIERYDDGRISTSFERTEWLHYASQTWSPGQAKKILRNLLGIIGVEDRARRHQHWYSGFHIDSQNFDAYQNAINNGGVFEKTVDRESIPVLHSIHNRTTELKERYGKGFYPRFSVEEVSKRTGLNKEETREHMNHLTGILAPVIEPYMHVRGDYDHFYNDLIQKWIIPKSRIGLTYQILGLSGMIK
ncbi:hypothetical protein CEE44_01265 [Candidatus Woesearchaeota archaeon B3_Woes]|nr:MAG: hypothetical protein CEE44_01265 [Candidatus Woesearchaeota archaeon B3_Woes]